VWNPKAVSAAALVREHLRLVEEFERGEQDVHDRAVERADVVTEQIAVLQAEHGQLGNLISAVKAELGT